jgi:hypothetical protein
MRLDGHLERIGGRRIETAKFREKRPLRRLSHGWEDGPSFTMDLQVLGCTILILVNIAICI